MKINQFTLYLSILVFLFVFTQNINAQSGDFYDELLDQKSLDTTRNLIFLDVSFKEYKGRAAITNGNLYVYLKLTENLDVKNYNEFVVDLIENKKTLAIDESRVTRNKSHLIGGVFEFILLSKDYTKLDDLTKNGKDKFIKCLFTDRLMKGEIVRKYKDSGVMYAVADKLFHWQVITQIDDPTGLLALYDYPSEVK